MKYRERISSYNNEKINALIDALEQKSIPTDYTTSCFIQGYLYSNERGFAQYAIENLPEQEDLGELAYMLEEADIQEFILMDNSTALMRGLYEFLSMGWQVAGTYEMKTCWDTQYGLRIRKEARA